MTSMDTPIVAKTIADQTYQHIRRDIISGKLAPGAKLGMERLTKLYGVGLSPLREALVRLTGDALVVAEGQRGFWVSQISVEELQDTMNTRLLIETQALALSIEKGDADWERAVRASYAELEALEEHLSRGDAAVLSRWEAANRRFHESLVSACGSPWLIRLRNKLHQHSERYRMISLVQTAVERDVHDEHEAIAEAVLARKSLRACRLTELHLQRTTEVVREALERQSGAPPVLGPRRRAAGRGAKSGRGTK